ncbi:hemolysin family protein [Jeotgalibacillus proteolyticus]|uniref:HlyC/CorC family transporter n=1 Tax=Jeotgalibacillus proteolyticus TaxID=2082395 RepID=A0A2S5G6S6_9BACL|nr:hemolysin family protein [Jeotgalibacillus proteolyticus]PPA68665.1 HlyC/CorC family transporter [Jeotgalibacillus proteolyticus]PPA68742.1 HlyC/CorC family transporter [Jeotgalibacillus proteolyticus]
MTIALVTLVVLILINAFFAASELALVNLNDNKVKRAADNGDAKAQTLYKLISQPSLFLSTIQIGITLAGFLSSAFAADFFAGPLAETLVNWGVPLSFGVLNTVSVITITIILSYFTLVFGELVPKQLALQKAEAISNIAATPLSVLAKISAPIIFILTMSTNAVVRLFGVDPNAKSEEATEEDIRMLVDVGRERGTINLEEKIMINNIFEFNDTIATDIITHRRDISALPIDATFEDVLSLIKEKRFTHFPVYEETIDNIKGVLHSKDLFQYIGNGEPFDLKDVIRKPFFVLESQPIDVLFASMQKSNMHIAIVIDEYGGTEGIITIEDVIEEIVGEISSESLETLPEQEIVELEPGVYITRGTVRLWELEEAIKVSLPSGELDTVSGFIIHELGYIPNELDKPFVPYKNVVFNVLEVSENRIERVKILVNQSEDSEPEE